MRRCAQVRSSAPRMADSVPSRGAVCPAPQRTGCPLAPASGTVQQAETSTGGERHTAMRVAYIFSTTGHTVSYKLGQMILPQLEEHRHGAEVVGMFFFDYNTYALRSADPLGERLGRAAARPRAHA